MRRVVEHINIQRQPLGRFGKRSDELIDQHVLQPIQRSDVDRVLKSRQRRLAREWGLAGRLARNQLKHGVRPQEIMIILIRIVSDDPEDPHPHHFQKRMLDKRLMARIIESPSELLRMTQPLIQLANRQKPRITRQCARRRLDNNGFFTQKREAFLKRSLYTHNKPPGCHPSDVLTTS